MELSLSNFDEHWQHHFDTKVENIIACFDLKFVVLAEVYCEALKCQHGLEVARYLGVKGHEGLCSWRNNIGSDDNLLSSWSLEELKSYVAVELKICCDKLDPVLFINPKLFQTEIYYFYSAAVELSRSLVLFEGWRNNREL